ncbi:hypothetical protein Agub_g3339, partial [Astrephomene gubernaculifera]
YWLRRSLASLYPLIALFVHLCQRSVISHQPGVLSNSKYACNPYQLSVLVETMLTRSFHSSSVASRPMPQRRSLVTPIPARSTLPRDRQVVCQGLFGLGLPEVAVIAGVAALIFGPSKLPELGKSLGKTVKSFQTAASEFNEELKAGMAEEPQKPVAEEAKKPDSN